MFNRKEEVERLSGRLLDSISAGRQEGTARLYRTVTGAAQELCGKNWIELTVEDTEVIRKNMDMYHHPAGAGCKPLTANTEITYRGMFNCVGKKVNKLISGDEGIKEVYLRITGREYFDAFDGFLETKVAVSRQESSVPDETKAAAYCLMEKVLDEGNAANCLLEKYRYWREKCMFLLNAGMGLAASEICRLRAGVILTDKQPCGRDCVVLMVPRIAKKSTRPEQLVVPELVLAVLVNYLAVCGRMRMRYTAGGCTDWRLGKEELLFVDAGGGPFTTGQLANRYYKWQKEKKPVITPSVFVEIHKEPESSERYRSTGVPDWMARRSAGLSRYLERQTELVKACQSVSENEKKDMYKKLLRTNERCPKEEKGTIPEVDYVKVFQMVQELYF